MQEERVPAALVALSPRRRGPLVPHTWVRSHPHLLPSTFCGLRQCGPGMGDEAGDVARSGAYHFGKTGTENLLFPSLFIRPALIE